MTPADLDRRVVFQRAIVTTNARNEHVAAGWTDVARAWARRTPVKDGEIVAAAQVQRVVTDRFVVRWSPTLAALTGEHQLTCDGVAYDIVGKKPWEDPVDRMRRDRWLEFSACARPEVGG